MENIQIRSDFALTRDQERRLCQMVRGRGHFDHEGGYVDGEGARHALSAIHFKETQAEGVARGDTTIDSFDGMRFPNGSPFIYLESTGGRLSGWNETRPVIPSAWHYGILLAAEGGEFWFCGLDAHGSSALTGEETLFRVDPVTLDHVRDQVGDLAENLPAEGEFWLSRESLPKITDVPWWGAADAERQVHAAPEERARMTAVLDRIRARIAECEAMPAP